MIIQTVKAVAVGIEHRAAQAEFSGAQFFLQFQRQLEQAGNGLVAGENTGTFLDLIAGNERTAFQVRHPAVQVDVTVQAVVDLDHAAVSHTAEDIRRDPR